MQILMLSNRYSPDAKLVENEMTWKIAGQFIKQGHDVRMIVPGNVDLSTAQPALALRLTPVVVTVDNNEYAYTRFDTKTTAGIELYVLKSKDDTPLAYSPKALGLAADALVASSDFTPEMIVAWNNEITIEGQLAACPLKVAAFTDLDSSTDGETAEPVDITKFDKLIIHGRVLANAIAKQSPSPLAKAITSGKATVVQLSSDAPRQKIVQKESAKASLQTSVGLPIEPQIPLFYMQLPLSDSADVLAKILTQQVQVICRCNDNSDQIQQLLETYPDRLCALPFDTNEEPLLNASDFCIQSSIPLKIASTLCACTVPIVPASNTPVVLDLDPSLKSGTGLIFENTPVSLEETLRHAVGMYSQHSQFDILRGRLSNNVVPLDSVIDFYISAN